MGEIEAVFCISVLFCAVCRPWLWSVSHLGAKHTEEDERTADVAPCGHAFLQDQCAADDAEHGFHREKDGGDRGIRAFLTENLAGIRHADRHKSAVEDRDKRCLQIGERLRGVQSRDDGDSPRDEADDGADDFYLEIKFSNVFNPKEWNYKASEKLAQEIALKEKRLKELQDKPVSLPDVVGKQVRHKTYGVGVVQSNDNGTLLVHFEKADKKFKYPSVFTQGFLSFAGEETQTGEMAEFEADQKKKAALEKEITQLKKSLKSITV